MSIAQRISEKRDNEPAGMRGQAHSLNSASGLLPSSPAFSASGPTGCKPAAMRVFECERGGRGRPAARPSPGPRVWAGPLKARP